MAVSKRSTPEESHRHRLKQRDLVMSIFSLFSEEFERFECESIWDVAVPIDRVKEYLQLRHNVRYKSNLWVYTQLKRYEDDLGVKLFRKEAVGTDPQDFALRISFPFVNFLQKQHLYVNQKIRVANGVYDKIRHFAASRVPSKPIRILLGAGSTIFHLAGIIAEKSREDSTRYSVYTHNLGALQQILNPKVDFRNVEVFTPQGRIDATTYTIVGSPTPMFESSSFDFIVQGTSRLREGNLYIESRGEWERKRAIHAECSGQKVLVLTKHELADEPLPGLEPYGSIRDYDWLVVPKRSTEGGTQKRYEMLFDEYSPILKPEIISWNYEIFRILGAAG